MRLSIHSQLEYAFAESTDIMLQIELADIPEQNILSSTIDLPECEYFSRIAGEDDIGERIWLRKQGRLLVDYHAVVDIKRHSVDWDNLYFMQPAFLSGTTVAYLTDSVYCRGSHFRNFVTDSFGDLWGGAKVVAMRDWIKKNITYTIESSGSDTTALDSFVQRQGVCRDFAHVMVAFARAATIPARVASVYAPNVHPQDFHAVAEVFLSNSDGVGGWHIVDATGMASEADIAKIGIGRDAGDIAFLTSYGACEMLSQMVKVDMLSGK